MPTETMTIEDREQARRDKRAVASRRRYHERVDDSRERCRLSKQEQRRRGEDGFPASAGRASYDPEDYAEEWLFLTALGVPSDQIIDRSRPAREWFVRHVLPLVNRSLCAHCGSVFDPQRARMLTKCSNACNARHGRQVPSSC